MCTCMIIHKNACVYMYKVCMFKSIWKIYNLYIHIFIYILICMHMKWKYVSMSQKIFNILTYLQICLFWVLTLGHYWVFLQEEKKMSGLVKLSRYWFGSCGSRLWRSILLQWQKLTRMNHRLLHSPSFLRTKSETTI